MDNQELSLNYDLIVSGEIMACLNQFEVINWDMWSALAAWTEILLVFIPAIWYFFCSKIGFVSYWVFDQTLNGLRVAIHNKTKSSLFILREDICVQNSQDYHTYCLPMKSNSELNQVCIKPDEVVYITIDYEIYHIKPMDKIILCIQFGGKRGIKRKKIRRGNIYVCKS